MDAKQFQEAVARLKEVNAVLKDLDPSLRPTATELFAPYLAGSAASAPPISKPKLAPSESARPPHGGDEFLASLSKSSPAANAHAITALFYSQYGSAPFSISEIAKKAAEVGLTVPARLDMTLVSSKEGGKSLYVRVGKGQYKPTVAGEQYLRATFNVSKGTKQKPEASS